MLLNKNNEKTTQKANKKDNQKRKEQIIWVIKITIISFILSIAFSFISNSAVTNLPVIPAILILILVIVLGVIFDIVGVAVTVADESEFHAMATKKIPGAKEAIKLIKNASQVSNICADVIGDICGVLSGAISTVVTFKITEGVGIPYDIQFIISAFVASFTIGGKALGKEIARKHSTKIISITGKIFSKVKLKNK